VLSDILLARIVLCEPWCQLVGLKLILKWSLKLRFKSRLKLGFKHLVLN